MTKNRVNDRSTRRAAWVALACLVFGHLYAKRATAAPRLTSSGIQCMPAANPTIDWTNLSYTIFGPANHTAGTRYLYCPTGVFQDVGYPNIFGFRLSGYDRSTAAHVSYTVCAYNPNGTSFVCFPSLNSFVTPGETGEFHSETAGNVGLLNIPANSHIVFTVSLPPIQSGNVSHVTSFDVRRDLG